MKTLKRLISLVIICVLVYASYVVFFNCKKVTTLYNRFFTLENYDYAKVSDDTYVKLLGVSKKKRKDDSEFRRIRVFVINNHAFSYTYLDEDGTTEKDLKKLEAALKLIEIDDDDKVTLELIKKNEE